jgi:dTDP-4-dehydrorhamnose reductase
MIRMAERRETDEPAAGGINVWLTGARGMLAREIRAELERLGVDVVGTDLELDIADGPRVRELARARRFTHIINCAAYTQVDQAETDVSRALDANAEGPERLGHAACETGATLLHFSTDYVFDGEATAPYGEEDRCAPTTVYGRSKLEGERRLLSVARERTAAPLRLFIVRTSWLFGEGRSSFVSTMLRLMSERETLRVVDDQFGRPTFARDMAHAALTLIGLRPRPERPAPAPGLYHYANSGVTTWHGFATCILELCRSLGIPVRTTEVLPISSAEYPQPARRPKRAVLATQRIESALGYAPRPWQEALQEHLADLKRRRMTQ